MGPASTARIDEVCAALRFSWSVIRASCRERSVRRRISWKRVGRGRLRYKISADDKGSELGGPQLTSPIKSKVAGKSPDAAATAEKLVSRLYDDILQEHCVVFVGAGSTTERHYWRTEPSFYLDIKTKANFPLTDPPPSFPDLMEYFCNQMDGGRHNRLIREAVARIERFSVPGGRPQPCDDVRQ